MIPEFANNAWLKKQNQILTKKNNEQPEKFVRDSLFMKFVVLAVTVAPLVSLFIDWFVI
ncbi:hypothetical protein [Faecalibaculum rodentium]|uniref:hypothetical protein n=1 Tax=Faecalibaculum rodentium TaxID=1702221 RepID=UPI00266FC74D|nr:hypothetical protein [Faecalibaculum rodentium]